MPDRPFDGQRRRLLALGASALAAPLLTPFAAKAADPKPVALTPDQQAQVKRVQDYLNGIRTLTSRFQQASSNGGDSEGMVWLSRPGRMRFEYDAPVPILLISDSRVVYYYDKELQQLTTVGLDDTPAWFLLRNDIRLGGDVTITRFEQAPGVIRITLVETKNAGAGTVTLVLSDRPMELRQWTVIDSQNRATTVTLNDPHYGTEIDPQLFFFKDPRPTRN